METLILLKIKPSQLILEKLKEEMLFQFLQEISLALELMALNLLIKGSLILFKKEEI